MSFRVFFQFRKVMAAGKDWKKVKSAVTINAALGNTRCHYNIPIIIILFVATITLAIPIIIVIFEVALAIGVTATFVT